MPTYRHGRHEHGQNFLTDPAPITAITRLVAASTGPVLEIGPGDGALTVPLSPLGRPLTAVEIDPRLAEGLARRLPPHARIITRDFLAHRQPRTPYVLVGNLPFNRTTAMLRKILHSPGWTEATLLVQWEVARRRAGVGGATMMTAQWAPWFEFALDRRVPAHAFAPSPGVDGGILTIRRRTDPLLPEVQRARFQALVHRVSTGPGHGLGQVLPRSTSLGTPEAARTWLRRHGITPSALPRSLSTDAWVDLFKTTGSSPPRRQGRGASGGRGRSRGRGRSGAQGSTHPQGHTRAQGPSPRRSR